MLELATYYYKGYRSCIEYHDLTEDCRYGRIHGINDEVLFDADSSEKFEEAFHTAVDEYLEFCEELGRSPDIDNYSDRPITFEELMKMDE